MGDSLLTTSEAALALRVSVHTLIGWRRPGAVSPLPYTRIGAKVFYHSRDVALLRERRVQAGPSGDVEVQYPPREASGSSYSAGVRARAA